ncbi:ImmA/IrrE family metallo-endopeptidase [Corynebacterium diphtheriae]|uniref:ImmA/IrrE family metallo-endopeptidase n=1 Tax=Corynebacterium diphtheriae TaxID=1717 RepID=UPI000B759D76|nr:ImmA/IrrE family metallo-endopeptidase [Corynebacterium diphtheriae]OWM43010.1 hypothetical protein BU164_10220 [Corynebacterium diphtheriae]OWM46787.1 hypothetical protein BU163_11090 [Corynebacterium diphtheriae]CAB0488949.1 ImmA/IrrE family metallo-endopeptidase [Corynebacterium diphtheriae]CAB0586035.1 ImmA/IrrE family metallo-endopeptidase [Corynebacterium diphtheriae]CAB0787794.1 ImmA/IrrE family metallo-endopeptidase [Corynebacterium diphtheriae]
MLLYEDARMRAQEILEVFPIGNSGLAGLVQLAATLGASVEFRPLEPSISGVVIKEDADTPKIYINSEEPMVRQRFTLAHEIGHLIERENLGKDGEYSFIDYRNNSNYDLHEFYADEFAGALLMPAREFLDILNKKGTFATAIHFGVSKPAVNKRMERLRKNPDPTCQI